MGEDASTTWRSRASYVARRAVIGLERRWDAGRRARSADERPEHFRIVSFGGHGNARRVVVRARVLDGPAPTEAVAGESLHSALGRTVRRFWTDELAGVPLRVRVGGVDVTAVSDEDGYVDVSLDPDLPDATAGAVRGEITLDGEYRGIMEWPPTTVAVWVTSGEDSVGVISDVDDTILHTGVERVTRMLWQTVSGSVLTRSSFPGAAALYRALEGGSPGEESRPVFYVSSSPWNLHDFLVAFLARHDFPRGPLLLRDLFGVDARRSHGSHKSARIDEILELHPSVRFVLVGDSGEHDLEIYTDVVRRHPGRVAAVYIREVRSVVSLAEPSVRTVEGSSVPLVLAPDSVGMASHAADLGLIRDTDVAVVRRAAASYE